MRRGSKLLKPRRSPGPRSEESRRRQSESSRGRTLSAEHCERLSASLRDRWRRPGYRDKVAASLSAAHRRLAGGPFEYEKHGDRTNDVRYIAWRAAVLWRAGYRCAMCGSGKNLEAAHIVPWVLVKALFRVLMYDVDNGQALCIMCHALTDPERARFVPAAVLAEYEARAPIAWRRR